MKPTARRPRRLHHAVVVALSMLAPAAGCAHGSPRPRAIDVPPRSDGGGRHTKADAPEHVADAAPTPRTEELLTMVATTAPSARTALVIGRGTHALAGALRARLPAVEVERRDPAAADVASKPAYDLVIAPEAEIAHAGELLRRVAPGGVLVMRWIDGERSVAREPAAGRFASFTAHAVGEDAARRFEHVMVERAGPAPLGAGDLTAAIALAPSEPFVRGVPESRPETRRVRVAGFAVRLPSGETILDVPHSEQGATHVRAPAIADRLAALAGPKPSASWSGGAPGPRSFAGALSTGRHFEGTRTSSTIVVAEGSLVLRSWQEASPDEPAERGVRTYELADARITSTVKEAAWASAFAKYEASVKRLPDALRKVNPVAAELAFDRLVVDVERLVEPIDGRFFEVLRFNWRLLDALRAADRLDPRRDLAAWTAATVPERSPDGPLNGRPQPTSDEREAYRALFLFGGVLAHRGYAEARRAGDKSAACALLAETVRLLEAYDRRLFVLQDIERTEAAFLAECGISL